ncbi:class A beta-lactamase [Lysobacter enzymogenes]|uniref:class A beta-lactamase n=1 Tax=Lysobacter enzymogenes TaxID=69 RepID=UPI0019CFEF7F|nr:class A beta-lactamase [Lysobacter enzymogenes]MBN7136331.1 class A beta-lactamase [Lysobacter enzymogenes]
MQRRAFLQCTGTLLLAGGAAASFGVSALSPKPAASADAALRARLAELEKRSGGRLGVSALDTADGRRFDVRGDERFAMCSTFKFLLAAAVLRKADRGELDMQQRLAVPKSALIAHSPITTPIAEAGGSASLAQLCEATMTISDNAAANLLLPLVGNPAGLTRFLRGIGDKVTRLDRNEPELNTALPGDPRDTTSPNAMLASMRTLLLGDALSAASRRQLTDWLIANQTGDKRLRAGLPKDWRIGDKTGSGNGTTNDIAIVWPQRRKPVFIATYLTQAQGEDDARSAILADAARALAQHWIGAA